LHGTLLKPVNYDIFHVFSLGALDEKAYDVYITQHDISQVVKHLTAGLNHPRQLKLWQDITEITKLLPDVFSGIRICLDDSVVMKNELKRFIIAYPFFQLHDTN
jgi:hypothetical protein